MLQELHEGHPGITRMKSLSRMYVWWPGISADTEKSVRLCKQCQEVQSSPPPAPLHPLKWPTRPWARLHLDFAGPFQGKNILVAIDAHSKWVDAVCTPTTSSSCVIEKLRILFATFGLPEMIVTDNGTCFVSQEFENFLQKNGIKHSTSAPYHPASNGLAERAVQVIKRGLRKVTDGTMSSRLAKVLLTYRITPQSTTGLTPSEMLLGRRPRTRLDLLKPNTAERVEQRQQEQKERHDSRSKSRIFRRGDLVFFKNSGVGSAWLPGKIVEITSPVSFVVLLEDGRRKRCHQDHLRHRVVEDVIDEEVAMPSPSSTGDSTSEIGTELVAETPPCPEPTQSSESSDSSLSDTQTPPDIRTPSTDTHRYPRRQRKPRVWFEPGTT